MTNFKYFKTVQWCQNFVQSRLDRLTHARVRWVYFTARVSRSRSKARFFFCQNCHGAKDWRKIGHSLANVWQTSSKRQRIGIQWNAIEGFPRLQCVKFYLFFSYMFFLIFMNFIIKLIVKLFNHFRGLTYFTYSVVRTISPLYFVAPNQFDGKVLWNACDEDKRLPCFIFW